MFFAADRGLGPVDWLGTPPLASFWLARLGLPMC